MELAASGTTLVAPKAKGIIDPSTGKPIGSNDAFFGEINNGSPTRAFWSPRPMKPSTGPVPAR